METDDKLLRPLLEALAKGEVSPEQAEREILKSGLTFKLGDFARLDMSRGERCGFPEFIYGEGKTSEQICKIMAVLKDSGRPVLATRLSPESIAAVGKQFPDAEIDALAKTAALRQGMKKIGKGFVLTVTAGTCDLPYAREAEITASLCGCETRMLADAGVAGLHRLLAEKDQLEAASVIIAVAGMEGALPSVIAGLVRCPVIAVPTPVGYGASFSGIAALLAMLNSCANGVTVVNIGNGFGAGCAAARIMRLETQ